MEPEEAEGSKVRRIGVHVEFERDLFFRFKTPVKAHKLDIRDGVSWEMRTLLDRAGVDPSPIKIRSAR